MKKLISLLFIGALALTQAALADDVRYGAIALGGNGFGATRGRLDEALAVSGAVRQCEESGGVGKCQVRLVYRNQCAAYAVGDDRQVGVAYASSLEEAGKLALRSCSENAPHCQLHYLACSTPASFN